MKKESGMSSSTKTLVVTLLVIAIFFSIVAIVVNLVLLSERPAFNKPAASQDLSDFPGSSGVGIQVTPPSQPSEAVTG